MKTTWGMMRDPGYLVLEWKNKRALGTAIKLARMVARPYSRGKRKSLRLKHTAPLFKWLEGT